MVLKVLVDVSVHVHRLLYLAAERARVRAGDRGAEPLLRRGRNAQRPDGGSVPATVHVLVHLLGNLLGVTEVRGGDGDSVEEAEESSDTEPRLGLKAGGSTHCIMTTMLWTLMVCRVQ